MWKFGIVIACLFASSLARSESSDIETRYWLKLKAKTKEERTALIQRGFAIDHGVHSDYVIAIGSEKDLISSKASGHLVESFYVDVALMSFSELDPGYHSYTNLKSKLQEIAQNNPDIVRLNSIGHSIERREILDIQISAQLEDAEELPGVVFVGTHHARERLSTEIPLKLIEELIKKYREGDPQVQSLLHSRDIHIIPMLNPDGVEYDFADGYFKEWRKNRRKNRDGSMGVDLNRNYSVGWAVAGSSDQGGSDVFHGAHAFSEPETLAFKNFVESRSNISILLSFHSYSELILYPWGGSYSPIGNARDLKVFETMANTMSKWNKYQPMQASDLYIASGDTVDWAYGEHKIFGFTFELDPKDFWDGGFYPKSSIVDRVFQKNWLPSLYLIQLADNPYQVLEPRSKRLGFGALEF